MFLIKKHEVVFAKEFLIDLQTLQRTEDEIHEFSKNNYRTGVVKKAQQRDLIARELKGSILRLEEDIKLISKGKGPEDNFNFIKIKNLVYNIEDLLRKQLEELNKIEILEDHLARTMAIDGTNMSGESQLTYEIRILRELLDSQEGVIARYIVEEEHELEKSQNTSNDVDNRSEEIKKRFIISEDGDSIYDQNTGLIWERNWSKRGKMNWSEAIEINERGFKIPSKLNFSYLNVFNRKNDYPFYEDLMKIGFVIDKNSWYWTNNEKDTINACVVNLCEDDSHESVGAKIIKNMYSVVCVKRK